MDIGKPVRKIDVVPERAPEPIEEPVPEKEPAPV